MQADKMKVKKIKVATQYPMIDASELLDEEIDPILARYPENK